MKIIAEKTQFNFLKFLIKNEEKKLKKLNFEHSPQPEL